MDLSILIPARNEMWLARTVQDILAHMRGDTEVIVVCDGNWPDPPIPVHPRVRVMFEPIPIGQRAATNLAARHARGTYVMKLDAHCSVAEGFDVELVKTDQSIGRPDVTQIPAMFNLHAFNWKCEGCGMETYQGPTLTACLRCNGNGLPGGPFSRVVYWDRMAGGVPGKERRSEFWRFDYDLHFQYHFGYKNRPEAKGEVVDVMSSVGACFFMRKQRFIDIGGLDESHGSWGQFGTEIACKSWLSGGLHLVNKRTWFAHLFRTQGGDFSFPYHNPPAAIEKARERSRRLWLDNAWPGQRHALAWLLERFAPIPGWHEAADEEADQKTTEGRRRELRRAREQRLADVLARGRAFAGAA